VRVIEISTRLSLVVIIAILVVTVGASLVSRRGKANMAIANARRHATAFLDTDYTHDPAERERIFAKLLNERDQILALGSRYRQMVRDEPALIELLERAAAEHDKMSNALKPNPLPKGG